MYGYEAATGLGGLAAQAQPNAYMARALQIRSPGAMLADSPATSGSNNPYSTPGGVGLGGPPQVSWSGTAVEQPMSTQVGGWRQILDFHNSPAPWIWLAILLIYGYVHVSYRRGRAAVGGGFT